MPHPPAWPRPRSSLSTRIIAVVFVATFATTLGVSWIGLRWSPPAAALVLLALGVSLLFSALAARVTAAIVKPVEALAEGARHVSQGRFDLELPGTERADEIGLLTRTFNDMLHELRRNQLEIERTNQQLMGSNQDLRTANEVLAQLSITDGLTKLHNHRSFQDHLTHEIKRADRLREPLCILLIDIDDFKSLNDRLGHAAGDEVLVQIALIMSASVRESDLLARYGGEEFVVLAANADLPGATMLAEKIRTSVSEASTVVGDAMRPTRITVSIGVARYGGSRKQFFRDADRALYSAKAEGKNCVVVAGDDA